MGTPIQIQSSLAAVIEEQLLSVLEEKFGPATEWSPDLTSDIGDIIEAIDATLTARSGDVMKVITSECKSSVVVNSLIDCFR